MNRRGKREVGEEEEQVREGRDRGKGQKKEQPEKLL